MKDLEFENIKKNIFTKQNKEIIKDTIQDEFKLTTNASLYKFQTIDPKIFEIVNITIPSDEVLNINPYSIEIKFINHNYPIGHINHIGIIYGYNIYGVYGGIKYGFQSSTNSNIIFR